MKLTVYYDGQYWIGIFETLVENQTNLKACKYIFGNEPADQEVLELVNRSMMGMVDAITETVEVKPFFKHKANPKRLAREAAKELSQRGVSTYAQTAFRLEREKQKVLRKQASREEREMQHQKRREIAVNKAKEKHRGH